MRVTWVHPSWRDLVIEHLASVPDARQRFLDRCSLDGALLALSRGGGPAGDRRRPLLQDDCDWDALTGNLYGLVPALEPAELVALLDELRVTIIDLRDDQAAEPGAEHEARAVAETIAARVQSEWLRTRSVIGTATIETWLSLARLLDMRVTSQAIATTWVELSPSGVPALDDRAAVERFADWTTLAELLLEHDTQLADALGLPECAERACDEFLNALDLRCEQLAGGAAEHALRALDRTTRIAPQLALHVTLVRGQLEPTVLVEPAAPPTGPTRGHDEDGSGRIDVERVLADL